jgi:hypothetical protein
MWDINKIFEDIGNYRDESSLQLNSHTPIGPFNYSYPIIWSGFLNNEEIVIKQLSDHSEFITEFEFINYPEKFNYLKSNIRNFIHEYLDQRLS